VPARERQQCDTDNRALPEIVYLIDITNEIGYEVRVAWWRQKMAGLAFQAMHDLGELLPEHLEFMKSALRDTKLRQVEERMSQGDSLLEAVQSVGLSKQAYVHARAEALQEGTLIDSLSRLETENTTLRTLLAKKIPPTVRIGLSPADDAVPVALMHNV
jgi:hypothetical protein